jgi:chemotaxis signal transduction protein
MAAPIVMPASSDPQIGFDASTSGWQFGIATGPKRAEIGVFGGRTLNCARDPVKKLLRFRTAMGEFAIPVESVREVRSDPALSSIPGAHPAVVGVLDWKGEALTVIAPFGEGRQLIVVEGGPGVYGLVVEEVLELAHRSDRELGRAPAESSAAYILGLMRSEGHMVPIVDAGLLWSSVGFEPEIDAAGGHPGGDLTGAGPERDGGTTPPGATVAL